MLFFQPLAFLVPGYATAPALMYVGLLMLSNVSKLDFDDFVGAMSGLVCAVFIVLTANIVTGIMLGLCGISDWSYREWRCEKTQHRHNYHRHCPCRILCWRLGDLIKYNLIRRTNSSPFLFLVSKNNRKTNPHFYFTNP